MSDAGFEIRDTGYKIWDRDVEYEMIGVGFGILVDDIFFQKNQISGNTRMKKSVR